MTFSIVELHPSPLSSFSHRHCRASAIAIVELQPSPLSGSVHLHCPVVFVGELGYWWYPQAEIMRMCFVILVIVIA
jgi:hypothetical protein